MRLIFLCAVLALATPAFAEEAKATPKPTVESLTAELTQAKATITQLQAIAAQLQAQRNTQADAAALALAEAALAQKDPPK